MKFLTILLLLFPFCSFATNYYVSNSGNNSNAGTTTGTAWLNITKVNSFSFGAGDSILFRRGDTFYGGIKASRTGLNFGAYGTGAKPIITGLSTVTGWVSLGSNLWEAPVTNVKKEVNLVMRNSVIQQVGRFPNANASVGGYLIYTAATTTSVTGPALSSTTNWTGAEVAVRDARWEIRRRIVTSHSGGTVNFSNIGVTPKTNYGYFFQRDARTLDQDGEWFYNSTTSKLRVYSNANPATYNYQISTVDSTFSSIWGTLSVTNMEFYGANLYSMAIFGKVGIKILNCDANYSGAHGISTWTCSNVLVDGCTTNYCLSDGLRIRGATVPAGVIVNLTVTNNVVRNTCQIAGMETSAFASSGSGIIAIGGQNVIVTNNYIINSGYNGIEWKGDNVIIKNNFIDSFCNVRDDGGGIYTFVNASGTIVRGTNRNISGNIILHGIGAPNGAPTSDLSMNGILSRNSANGIYIDEMTYDVTMDSNTVAYMPYQGIQGNGNAYITIRANTIFSTPYHLSSQRLNGEPPITNFIVKKNIFYPYRWRFRDQDLDVATQNLDIQRYGLLDSNYYSTRSGTDTSLNAQTTPPFSENWRSFSYIKNTLGMETHSVNYVNTGLLYYNASNTPTTATFTGLSKKDVYGNVYNNSATIPAWSSKVLMVNGTTTINPTANAGVDKNITLPTSNVSVTGSGTDPDGTITAYLWTKISGPSGGTIASPTSATTNITALQQGTYAFSLRVTDNDGLTGSDFMQVVVNPSNVAPTANAGIDQTITLPTSTTTLVGIGTDPDGSIASYLWAKISGPTGGTITSSTSATTGITALQQGTYVFQLTVTDNNGATGTDFMQVIVNPANVAPTADAGADQSITLPVSTTTLVGSGSDPGGVIVSYLWTKISGPTGGTIASPTASSTGITALQQGTYIFQLTVTDNGGLTGSDFVQVLVNPAIPPVNIPPTADAGIDQSITLPTNTATLTGSGNDPDGTIAAYLWTKISGPSGGTITSPTLATTGVTGLLQGTYVYQLRVTDNSGDTATDAMQIVVNPANVKPVANAGVNQVITLPTSTTTLVGTGTDPDGTITAYLWSKISGPSGGAITSSTSATTGITGLIQGVYTYQLRVTDNSGDTATDAIQVTVNAANVFPTANAGADQTITLPTDNTTLVGSGTDTDGTIAGYLWTKLSGPSGGTITSSTNATTGITGLIEGVYIYQLRVTDNSGDTAVDAVQITVNALVQNPTSNAGANRVITLPSNDTTLTGTGTAYGGATIISYLWEDVSGPTTGTIVTPNAANTTVSNLLEGTYIYKLTVTDSNGNVGESTVLVVVFPEYIPREVFDVTGYEWLL